MAKFMMALLCVLSARGFRYANPDANLDISADAGTTDVKSDAETPALASDSTFVYKMTKMGWGCVEIDDATFASDCFDKAFFLKRSNASSCESMAYKPIASSDFDPFCGKVAASYRFYIGGKVEKMVRAMKGLAQAKSCARTKLNPWWPESCLKKDWKATPASTPLATLDDTSQDDTSNSDVDVVTDKE